MQDFKRSVLELKSAISSIKSKGISLNESEQGKVYDFNKSKEDYYKKAVFVALEKVKKNSGKLLSLASEPENTTLVEKAVLLARQIDISNMESTVDELISLLPEIKVPKVDKIKKPGYLPEEIREDINADIEEMNKTYNAGCYRSTAILCGRILEVALHMKYYKATGVDLLEKSPGIGLGKIVAKLSEKNITFDPGLMQQIHLINNVRISSVHIKQKPFKPTKAQAQAMMLYTLDILEKVFRE